jgi:tetratricopeptide (TPR) repeat protein
VKPWRLFLCLAAGANPAGLSAQEGDTRPPPVPSVMIAPPVPIAPPLVDPDDPAVIEYRQSCGRDNASVRLGFERAAFIPGDGVPARLVMCNDRFSMGAATELNSIELALAFMAYEPFEPFWDAAEERWGKDLGKLRAELKDAAYALTSEGYAFRTVDDEAAQAMTQARALSALGYYTEAQQLLEEALDTFQRRAAGSSDYDFDLTLIAITAAGIQSNKTGPVAASNLLEAFARRRRSGADFEVNLDINRAAYLAESGRYREALDLLIPAYRIFRDGEIDSGNYRISGSNREFSWILACAYRGLGDDRLAQPFIDVVYAADEIPTDRYLDVTKRSTDIRLRMTLCMDDSEAYYAVWREIREPFLSRNWLAFQRGGAGPWIGGIRRDWVGKRGEARSISRSYRQLPARYTPALNRWQDPPKSGN